MDGWTDLCEDEEIKERISEIQREIEHSRLAKSRELSRRRSTNVIRRFVLIVGHFNSPDNAALEVKG